MSDQGHWNTPMPWLQQASNNNMWHALGALKNVTCVHSSCTIVGNSHLWRMCTSIVAQLLALLVYEGCDLSWPNASVSKHKHSQATYWKCPKWCLKYFFNFSLGHLHYTSWNGIFKTVWRPRCIMKNRKRKQSFLFGSVITSLGKRENKRIGRRITHQSLSCSYSSSQGYSATVSVICIIVKKISHFMRVLVVTKINFYVDIVALFIRDLAKLIMYLWKKYWVTTEIFTCNECFFPYFMPWPWRCNFSNRYPIAWA